MARRVPRAASCLNRIRRCPIRMIRDNKGGRRDRKEGEKERRRGGIKREW